LEHLFFKAKDELLEALGDIEIAQSLIKQNKESTTDEHPIEPATDHSKLSWLL
jgi:hypothetical protein